MTRDRRRRGPPAAEPLRAPGQPGLRRAERATPSPSAARTTAGPTATPASWSAFRSSRATAATASSTWRSGAVPRIDSLPAASCSAASPRTVPRLAEHLGEAAGELDRLARLSPEGRVELTAGWLQHRTRANWKLLAENETDGYHPQFVHGSIFSVTQSPIGALYSDDVDGGDPRPRQRAQRERPAARSSASSASRCAGSAPRRRGYRTTWRDARRPTARPRRADPDRGRART